MLNPILSNPTGQDALVEALRYAESFGIRKALLQRKYGLNRNTLTQISKGTRIKYHRQQYYDTIILALNDCRLQASVKQDFKLVEQISKALISLCLINANIAPDTDFSSNCD